MTQPFTCPECHNQASPSLRFCPHCGADMGFPNVRQAQAEKSELEARYHKALTEAEQRGARDALESFADHVNRHSQAVMARPLNMVDALLSNPNQILSTYRQRQGNSQIPEGSKWDILRPATEAALFPGYEDQIHYAMLSFEDKAPDRYGDVSLVFNQDMIKNRATAYEMNTVMYLVNSDISFKQLFNLPKGFQAIWDQRGELAAAKSAVAIGDDACRDDYQSVLVQEKNGEDDVFVEVHIYGIITALAVAKVKLHPTDDKRQVLYRKMKSEEWSERLNDTAIQVEA